MNNFKLKKLLTLITVTFIAAVAISPIKASAAWKQDSNGWWNTKGSSYSIGWENINNVWYYFNSNGYMKTGWVNDGGTWYYMQSSGAMKTGWANDGGTWYYMQSSGAMKTGLTELNGKIYYLSESGAMKTGNVTVNGVNYTFATSGEKVNSAATTNTTAASNGSTATSTGSGSSGGSSSSNTSSSSIDTSKYKNLYGTYTIGNYVSTNGTLSNETLTLFKDKQIIIKDTGINYKGTTVPITSITENTMTSSDFNKQYNVEVSGDTVKAVSSTLNYKGITENITVYTAKDKNNQEVHYVSTEGALLELKK